ncbi:MAG: hypothetical protein IIV79_01735, partial [Clostridia bacterium]|nr:hypothetical protein [Clostridia bacterium]
MNQELLSKFLELYGGDASDVRMFVSPGRVNMIGEHTDYNGGFVFPAALEHASHIIVRKTDSGKIRLAATDLPDRVELDLNHLDSYKPRPDRPRRRAGAQSWCAPQRRSDCPSRPPCKRRGTRCHSPSAYSLPDS